MNASALIVLSCLVCIIFVLLPFIIFCCDRTGRLIAFVLLVIGFFSVIKWYAYLGSIKDSISMGQMAIYSLAYPLLSFVVLFLAVWGIGACRKKLTSRHSCRKEAIE